MERGQGKDLFQMYSFPLSKELSQKPDLVNFICGQSLVMIFTTLHLSPQSGRDSGKCFKVGTLLALTVLELYQEEWILSYLIPFCSQLGI
jgi:hypothetical protein